MEHNRAMNEMYLAAVEMLKEKNPLKIAENAKVTYYQEERIFRVPSLGEEYEITYPEYLCNQKIDEWHYLTILHYLNLADGTALTEKNCNLGQLPDGVVRGTKFDQTVAMGLSEFLKDKTEQEVSEVFENLGGVFLNTTADMTVRLSFLPCFPLTINIWFADEEFPPSARLLVDESAGHYLTIEDAVTVGDYVLRLLKGI